MVAVTTGTMKRAHSSAYRFAMGEYLPNQNPRLRQEVSIRTIRAVKRYEHHSIARSVPWNRYSAADTCDRGSRCFHSTSSNGAAAAAAAASSSASSALDHLMEEDTEPEDNSEDTERLREVHDHFVYDSDDDEKNVVSIIDASDSSNNKSHDDHDVDDESDQDDEVDSRPYQRDSTKLDELATQLPGIVDEILKFHDEIGNNQLQYDFRKLILREHQKMTPRRSKARDKPPPRQKRELVKFDAIDENHEIWDDLDASGGMRNPWDLLDEQSNVASAQEMASNQQSINTPEEVVKYPWDDLGSLNTATMTPQREALGTSPQWASLSSARAPEEAPHGSIGFGNLWDSIGLVDPNTTPSRKPALVESNEEESHSFDHSKIDDSRSRNLSNVGNWNFVDRPRFHADDSFTAQQSENWVDGIEEHELESTKRKAGSPNERFLDGNQSTTHDSSRDYNTTFEDSMDGPTGLRAGESADNTIFEREISAGHVNFNEHIVDEASSDKQVFDTGAQPDFPYYMETEADKRRKVLFAEGIVLLRILSENDWQVFDRPHSQEDDEQNTSLDNTMEIPKQQVSNTGRDVSQEDTKAVDQGKIALDQLSNLLTEANLGREPLLAADYNLLLVRMAISPELLPDEILDFMLQTYNQMIRLSESGFEVCAPNADTNEIILLALCRRFSAYKTASQIISQLLLTDSFASEPKTLKAASFLCEKQSEHEIARQILLAVKNHKSTKIPNSTLVSFLKLMKKTDSRNEAIELLNFALERASTSEKINLDKVFTSALRWPSQNRYGGAVDNSQMLNSILTLIEKKPFTPGVQVWKTLIEQAAAGAREDSSRWKLVQRAFRGWFSWDNRPCYPYHTFLRHGLDACSALLDSELAATLISRHLQASTPSSRTYELHAQSEKEDPIPFQDIVKALQVCVCANDMQSFQRIMGDVRPLLLTVHKLQILFLLNLKGFANRGDTASAQKILDEMKGHNIYLGDDAYGSFLYACAVEKNLSKAREIFRSLELGELGSEAGPLCYEGFILACVRSHAWEDALSAFNTMKEKGVEPSPAVHHGVLLSTARSKGMRETITFLRDLLTRNGSLNRDCSLLAVKLLIPEVEDGASSLSDLRDKFKLLGEAGQISREKSLSVVRSLRVAELEEQRKPGHALKQDVISDRRKEAWTNFLKNLLEYVDATDDDR